VPDVPLDLASQYVAEAAKATRGGPTGGAFLQAADQGPKYADYQSYSPHSGEILGVLKRMLTEFETSLQTARKDEAKSEEDHSALASAKQQQIDVAKEKLDNLEEDHAVNQKALADAKEDLETTRKQRTTDIEFLQNLKTTCNDLDKDWERRSQTRAQELKAVAEAISILTEDDNRETLARSVALVQERMGMEVSAAARARRALAAESLRRAAQENADFDVDDLLAGWRSHNNGSNRAAPKAAVAGGPKAQLSALAMVVQLDSFGKVKEMIDKMVAELKRQQTEEANFKAYCKKEFSENEKATYSKGKDKKDFETKIDALADAMDSLEKEISHANAEIAEVEAEVKKAGSTREQENAEFQTTVADQRATQTILQKALLRLQDFYSKGIGNQVTFTQRSAQTPQAQFTKYKTNAGASPVMGLLEQIIEDSKQLEAEATTSETRAQADYEEFVKDSNAMITQLSSAVAQKTKASADAKLESAEAESNLESADAELESLAAYESDLHAQCDFVLKNFDVRQKARLQEIEAIQAAKAILSGAAAL